MHSEKQVDDILKGNVKKGDVVLVDMRKQHAKAGVNAKFALLLHQC